MASHLEVSRGVRLATIVLAAALHVALASAGRAQQLFYEDFEDETLAGNSQVNNGVISGGVASFNDESSTIRATYTVVQDFFEPVMTFSFDLVAPIVRTAEPASFEVLIRAGVGTAHNTLQNADQVIETIVWRDGNRGAFQNNGMETIFMIANNKDTNETFNSPIDGSPVTLTAFQQAAYVLNHSTSTFGLMRAPAGFNPPLNRPMTRLGIGSSSTGHIGTFAIDNVLVMAGATFERTLVSKKPGDVNDDNVVDLVDYGIIRDNFQKSVTMRGAGDLNNDGLVNFLDYRQWRANYVPPAPGASVPEPASGLLLAFGAFSLKTLNRRLRRRMGV